MAGLDRTRARRTWARDSAAATLTTAVALAVAIAVVDGVQEVNLVGVLIAAVAVGVGDLALQRVLRPFARSGGAAVALVIGLTAQLVLAFAALWLAGLREDSPWQVLAILVIASVVMAAGRWLWGSHDRDYVVGCLLRRARRQVDRSGNRPGTPDPEPGLLVVMFDGVARPVLDQAIEAGLAPTVQRWLTSGTHTLESWWAQVPSSTPATQAGLLHRASDQIPAFRWWDRSLGRLVVTNHPSDAARVEASLSDGQGLLRGGTAVSLMFSGDAERNFLVMSHGRAEGRRLDLGPGGPFLQFFASPFLLARALSLTGGEILKELYQSQRQKVNDVRPRIERRGWHVVLRAVTNVLLRDLSTSLVADAMVRGDPVVMVDYVDYDVIAHLSGPTRPEAMRSVEGLDGVLATLEAVSLASDRPYRIVVCSDHGQSLGTTFEQLEGRSLLDTVRALMDAPQARAVESVPNEEWGPLNALLATFLRPGHRPMGPRPTGQVDPAPGDVPEVVVAASGNLGMVWFPEHDHRLNLDELEEIWPGLVAGLAARTGVGVVVVDSSRGLLAVGARGVHPLESAAPVEGEDPLVSLGPRAGADLARVSRLPNAGDLVLISSVTDRGHVHAFEGQVGSHGGLGGDQNEAFMVHPQQWSVDEDLRGPVGDQRWLIGADAFGEQLQRWLKAGRHHR